MNAALSPVVQASYRASFLDALAEQSSPAWLRAQRERAFDSFIAQGWPHTKQEAWRFTDVRGLVQEVPVLPGWAASEPLDFDPRLVELGRGGGHRICFLDGRHDASAPAGLPLPEGLRLAPLSDALRSSVVEQRLGRHLQSQDAFALLNTAFMADGAFIEIPAGLIVEAPIFVVYLAGAQGCASFPRTVIAAGADSQATIIELHLGARDRATLSNAVTEVDLAPGARLAYQSIERPSPAGVHIGHLAVTQRRSSTFNAHSLVLGGRLVRNDAHVVLAEEQADCRLDGLYLAAGDGHVDNQTSIDHRAPRCRSRESYRGAVSGRGQAVWSGRAVVRPGAQGTDARQESRSLVLSDGAVVHAKPHLEIFANDVKCSHGATTGRLDAEAMFYLRSRGIDARQARAVLIAAFLRQGLAAIGAPPLRGELEAAVAEVAQTLSDDGAAP